MGKVQCEICGEWFKESDIVGDCCRECYDASVAADSEDFDYEEEDTEEEEE